MIPFAPANRHRQHFDKIVGVRSPFPRTDFFGTEHVAEERQKPDEEADRLRLVE